MLIFKLHDYDIYFICCLFSYLPVCVSNRKESYFISDGSKSNVEINFVQDFVTKFLGVCLKCR